MYKYIAIVSLFVPFSAFAGGSGHGSGGSVQGHQEQGQVQRSTSDASASSVGVNTNANRSSSAAKGGSSDQSQGQSASNGGNTLSSNDDSVALALGLGSVAAAPVDTSACRTGQTAGWRVALVERSGRNKLDASCVRESRLFAQCMDIARAYLTAGLKQSYAAQLVACGGVGDPTEAKAPAPVEYATREYVQRIFEATQHK